MQGQIWLVLFVLTCTVGSFAGTNLQATTTLTAETSNNTSAANSFVTQTNGNLGATNISKVSLRTLLYPGSTAKIYAHLVVWFGFGTNMDVGYSSGDPAQVHNQVTDMISRGIDGAIINWYGQGKLNPSFVNYDQAAQLVMKEAELHPSFNFALMPDGGALKTCSKTVGCDVTQTLINDLTYAYNTYETSPAYLHFNNRPVVYFFGEEFYNIDWNKVRTSVAGNPLFIFRNTDGFNYSQSNGAFAWVEPETITPADPMGLGYMGTFDSLAQSLLPTYSNVAAYKGFNDSLAAWGSGRLVQQQCGQTWLQTIALSGNYFSVSKQMLGIQLVTWNDYEEGTEFESGIDNCVAVTASAQGTVVSWSTTGQSNTVDHYTVFASQDGENLIWLADVPSSTNSLDLAQFNLNVGTYTAFVKAVGKPSIANKMSAGASLTIIRQPPPGFAFTPNGSTSATVAAGQTATYNLTLTSKNSGFTGTVSLSCTGAAAGVSCNVNPGSVNLSAGTVSVPVTVTAATTSQAHLAAPRFWTLPFTFAAIIVGGLCAAQKRTRKIILTAAAAFVISGIVACGGAGNSNASNQTSKPPTSATLTVTGAGSGQSATATLTLTITH